MLIKGISLASGYATRAAWLAALKVKDLAVEGKGPITDKTLFAGLIGSIPHGITFQKTLGRTRFVSMVQQHQAWVAKNYPGFYAWQHKFDGQVRKQIEQENSL
jgi:hypothetical protein